MKTNFRLNLKQNEMVLRKSINELKSDAVKGIAEKIINAPGTYGGADFLKAHGDVTWSKGGLQY
jgi:hypothetical protein